MDTTGLLCAPARRPTGLSVDRENMRTMPSVQPRANTGQGSSGESWELLALPPRRRKAQHCALFPSNTALGTSRTCLEPSSYRRTFKSHTTTKSLRAPSLAASWMLGAGRQGPVEYRCCAVRCAWATSWSKKRTSRTLPVADLLVLEVGTDGFTACNGSLACRRARSASPHMSSSPIAPSWYCWYTWRELQSQMVTTSDLEAVASQGCVGCNSKCRTLSLEGKNCRRLNILHKLCVLRASHIIISTFPNVQSV
mmetsp:Transcript_17963/g.50219  ORF Transcript_17963/g.50219 Transcript_17963/m.50219 type:complete len:253 (-) Transcript_17963:53-811(-)